MSDIISLDELKEKNAAIQRELDAIEKRLTDRIIVEKNEKSIAASVARYARDIEAFLALKTVTNADMKKMITHITVTSEGKIKIYFRHKKDAVTL